MAACASRIPHVKPRLRPEMPSRFLDPRKTFMGGYKKMKGTGAKMNGILLLPVLILALALLIGSSVKASAEEPPTPLEKIKSADNLAKGKPTYASSGNSKSRKR